MQLGLGDHGQIPGKGVDGRWNKDHHELDHRGDLQGRRRRAHHEAECPESVPWKGKRHDRTLPEASSIVQKIRHTFQGEIDAADQGNPIDRRLGPMDNALSDDLRGDGADDEHHAKQQQDAEAWSVGLDLSSDEIEQERIQGFEQGRKDQKRGPRRDQYNEPREKDAAKPMRRSHVDSW